MDVNLDFIMELPFSNGYNAVLIMIDRLTKERHFIFYIIDIKGTIAEATTYVSLNNVLKLYVLPLSLSLDQSS